MLMRYTFSQKLMLALILSGVSFNFRKMSMRRYHCMNPSNIIEHEEVDNDSRNKDN